MIALNTIDYSESGSIVLETLKARTQINDATRRVSRTKTLDGGVVLTDGGFSDGDRTFEIYTKATETAWSTIKTLFEDNALLHISLEHGCYSGAIEKIRRTDGEIYIRFLVKEKISD